MIVGSLAIGAAHASNFHLPLGLGTQTQGSHCVGRYTGLWSIAQNDKVEKRTLFLPHRDKELDVHYLGSNPFALEALMAGLESLDASYEGETQLYKYNQLLLSLRTRFPEEDDLFSVTLNTASNHSSLSFLSQGEPIELIGVLDPQLESAYLVWGSGLEGTNLVTLTRQAYPLKYLVYRFPTILNRSVFVPTQAICAHWWKYMKGENPLFAFNALELKLFK